MGDENIEADMVAGAAEGADGHMLDEADVWFLADAIPEGTSAAVALIEHRWAFRSAARSSPPTGSCSPTSGSIGRLVAIGPRRGSNL
jgi:hypothetical protein